MDITVTELLEELRKMGLAVHVELATLRILHRRLTDRLKELEKQGPEP